MKNTLFMLRIEMPAKAYSGLDFSKLQQMDLPSPRNGFSSEINNNIILLFEDEEDAIEYAYQVDSYAESLDDQSALEYKAANEIIKAISDDDFVRSYILD